MAEILLSAPIRVDGGASLDFNYGPWNSVAEYKNYILNELGGLLSVGTTIGVIEGSTIVEYWNPTTAGTFIKKAQGGGSGSTPNDAKITIRQGGVVKGSFTTDQADNATIDLDGGSGSAPSDAKITIKQGGVTKGFFTLNQTDDASISLDSGGGSGDCATCIIDLAAYHITEGYLNKDASGHYSDAQYDKMAWNGWGISHAIMDAAAAGYTKVKLPQGTYCFCYRDYDRTYAGAHQGYDGLPCINIFDINNMEIDFGGSKLCLLVDSLDWGKYTQDRGTKSYAEQNAWLKGQLMMTISYCNNLTIRNGNFVGDRFIREYRTSEAAHPATGGSYNYYIESANESTYGITICGGNREINIEDCNFEGFMGDGINGFPNTYYWDYPDPNTTSGTVNQGSFLSYKGTLSGGQVRGLKATPENTYRAEGGVPKQGTSCENTCLTDYYDTEVANALYDRNPNVLVNRKACKDARLYAFVSAGGYQRTCDCYPNNIGILTYSAKGGNPLRYFEVGYMDKFQLSPSERYIRLQYHHENHCAPASKLTLVSNPMFAYKCTRSTTGQFDANRWQRLEFAPSVTSPTYNTSTQYVPGDTVYYYAMGVFTPTTGTVSGTWDQSKWTLLPHCNLGLTNGVNAYANYDATKSYTADSSKVQNIITSGYVPTTATGSNPSTTTDYVWTTYVEPVVAIGEMHTFGVKVTRCQFINCHRGNMSNMPNDTVVSECTFRKYLYTPNCGYTAPNFCGYFDDAAHSQKAVVGESTQYHIDLEDYVCTNFKLINCRFESTDHNVGKVLLNTLNHVIDGCSGQINLCIYPSNQTTYVTNNNFDRFYFSLFEGNERLQLASSAEKYKRFVVLENNKLVTNNQSYFKPWCGNVQFVNNQVEVDTVAGSNDHWGYEPYSSGPHSFRGNIIRALKKPESFQLSARYMADNTIQAAGTTCMVHRLCKAAGTYVDGGRLKFKESWDDNTIFEGFDSHASENQIGVCYKTGNSSKITFKNCSFIPNSSTSTPISVEYQTSHTAKTLDIYFNDVVFENQPVGSTAKYFMHLSSNVSGDIIKVHFNNCTFNMKNANFANAGNFQLAECKNCTFITTPKFNGTPLANA